MRRIRLAALTFSLLLLAGCTTERAFFPTPSVPTRLGEKLENVEVYVKNTNGEYIKAYADLYPGMYIYIDPTEWDEQASADFQNIRRRDD